MTSVATGNTARTSEKLIEKMKINQDNKKTTDHNND